MALTIIENIGVSMLLKQEKQKKEERFKRMESRLILMESSRNMVHPEPTIQEDCEIEEEACGEKTVSERNKYLTMILECVNPPGTGKEKADHLDRVCRYVFPMIYAVSIGILAGVQVAN